METISEYFMQFNDEMWPQRKMDVLEESFYQCEMCCKKNVPVDVYLRFICDETPPWMYHEDDLIVLCSDCHEDHINYLMECEEEVGK